MDKISDQQYLLAEQYRDASNLNARIRLHERFSTNTYNLQLWIFDHFDLPAQAHILELGCGPGQLWRNNLHRIPAGWEITLSDFSPGMLEKARGNLDGSAHPFTFERIDAQSIPFPPGSFDGVIANYMLYHVPDRPQALSEIQRVLRPGGRFYAATIGDGHMKELDELVSTFDPAVSAPSDDLVGAFSLENGREQLEAWFSDVTLHRFEDGLVVTEAEPLVEYVLSSTFRWALASDRVDDFRSFLEGELRRHGVIHITKDTGLFSAARDI
ncbi:MAG TPA: class I SAM-dependent methyltransferase [Chloroflexia bacterium]|nr:class I SAM-dependent methyltransferase [Chloroflexia bacterium]